MKKKSNLYAWCLFHLKRHIPKFLSQHSTGRRRAVSIAGLLCGTVLTGTVHAALIEGPWVYEGMADAVSKHVWDAGIDVTVDPTGRGQVVYRRDYIFYVATREGVDDWHNERVSGREQLGHTVAKIGYTPQGKLCVLYNDGPTFYHSLFLKCRPQEGTRWSDAQLFAQQAWFPTAMAFGSDEAPHLVYSQAGTSTLYYRHGLRLPERVDNLPTGTKLGESAAVAVDADGEVHVVYAVQFPKDRYGRYAREVRYARRTSQGWKVSMISADRLDRFVQEWQSVDLTLTSSGEPVIAYHYAYRDTLYVSWQENGIWQRRAEDSSLAYLDGDLAYVAIAVDDKDQIHLTYSKYTGKPYPNYYFDRKYQTMAYKMWHLSGSYPVETTFDNVRQYGGFAMVLDANRRPHVAWSDNYFSRISPRYAHRRATQMEELTDGVLVNHLAAPAAEMLTFRFEVPPGTNRLDVLANLSSAVDDADLYVRYGAPPTPTEYDCSGRVVDNNETCRIDSPAVGTWYVGLYALNAFRGVMLTATNTGPELLVNGEYVRHRG